ncbi:MAG: Nicotinamide-nucleotide amidohydrolase PncC [Pseudomonadota bacterium]
MSRAIPRRDEEIQPALAWAQLEIALEREARRVARLLQEKNAQLVLAESCTGGMAAAALTRVPGVSKHFCGSAVVYQSETKTGWLKITPAFTDQYGPESVAMSEKLARRALQQTPQATLSAAITGDLGPSGNVGRIFIACRVRGALRRGVSKQLELLENEKKLKMAPRIKSLRACLQLLASQHLLRMVRQVLSDSLR